jgi:hypothetical protein
MGAGRINVRLCSMISEETGLSSAQLFFGESSDRPLLSIVVPLFNEQEVFSELQLRFLELEKRIGKNATSRSC